MGILRAHTGAIGCIALTIRVTHYCHLTLKLIWRYFPPTFCQIANILKVVILHSRLP